MKKLMSLGVVFICLFGLVGCGSSANKPITFTEDAVTKRGASVYVKRGEEYYLLSSQDDFYSNGSYLYFYNEKADTPNVFSLQRGDELVVYNSLEFEQEVTVLGPYFDTGDYTIGMVFLDDGIGYPVTTNGSVRAFIGDAKKVINQNHLDYKDVHYDEFFVINGNSYEDTSFITYQSSRYLPAQLGDIVTIGLMDGTKFKELDIVADIKVYGPEDGEKNIHEIDLDKNVSGYTATTHFTGNFRKAGIYRFNMFGNTYLFFYESGIEPESKAL